MPETILYPPLPPGCEDWLKISSGFLAVRLDFIQGRENWIVLDPELRPETTRQMHPWIAARCRCEWLDEAERLGRSQQPWQQSVAALAAAEAWKIWGQA